MLTHDVLHAVSRTQLANVVGHVLQLMGNDLFPASYRREAFYKSYVSFLEVLLLAPRLQVSG